MATLTLNGRHIQTGNESFRKSFFEHSGWDIADLSRIHCLSESALIKNSLAPFSNLLGMRPGQSEKNIWMQIGIPRTMIYDRFWFPHAGLFISEPEFLGHKFSLQMVLLSGKLEFILLQPRQAGLSEQRCFEIFREILSASDLPVHLLDEEDDGMVSGIRFQDGTTLLIERMFSLRMYLLSPELSYSGTNRISA